MVANRTLSPAGLAWLTMAVDPWHDTAVTGMTGLPDQGIGKSVTFQVVQEYQISAANSTVAIPADSNWSCRIGNHPFLTTQILRDGLFYGDVLTQTGNTPVMLQPVQVNYALDGAEFDAVAVNSSLNAQGCTLPVDYTKGVVKVCGMGIEVINTTSALHKQGLMSCARMVQPETESFTAYMALTTPANAWGIKSLTPVRTLPKNLSELALYPGFAQEEAKDGYYAPVLLKFNRYPHYPTPYGTLLLDDDPSAGTFNTANPIACWSSSLSGFSAPGNTSIFYCNKDLPLYYGCDSNVVMFTGLSYTTTLNLRVRWILERFPSDAEGQILVISSPSADYDPIALEIYSKCVQRMPAGVPFTENPAGEWWKNMLVAIADVATPLLKSLPGPLGMALGTAAQVGSRALHDTFEEQKRVNLAKRKLDKAQARLADDKRITGSNSKVGAPKPMGGNPTKISPVGGGRGRGKKKR